MPDALFFPRLIALLWLGWGLYWIVAAASSKRTVRRESAGARVAYVIPLLIGVLLIAWRGTHQLTHLSGCDRPLALEGDRH